MENVRLLIESNKPIESIIERISHTTNEASSSPSLFRQKLLALCRDFNRGGLSTESMAHTMQNLSENLKTYMY